MKKPKRDQKSDEGSVFYHQMLGAVIVYLERSTAPPLDFEPITIVAKPGSNAMLFETLDLRMRQAELQAWETVDEETGVLRGYRICEQVPLNDSHADLLVNCLEYHEFDDQDDDRNWQWVSSLEITPENAEQIMRAAFTTVKASDWEGFMRFRHRPGDFAFEIPSDRPA